MKKIIDKYNLLFFLPLVVIIIASFFCMYEARFVKTLYKTYLIKQTLWFFTGFILIIILKKIKIKFLFQYSFYFYLINLFLLILVLFIGKEINGARAWISYKVFNFQPSEFMKLALILYLSKITNDFRINKKHEFLYILKCILIVLLPSILVFLEPDTGAIIFYILILIAILFSSNIRKRWLIIGFILFALFISSFIYMYIFEQDLLINLIGTSLFYRMDRLINFKDGSGMQINNALTTIGNAGFFGHGIQKNLLYVPEFPTDFAFTLFISIFGFIGGITLLLAYFIINIFFINKMFFIKQKEYKYFIHAFIYIFIFSQIQNILMNLSLMPIMGIPLPFLSYGGSNMIVYFIMIGIILNIVKKKKQVKI